jgi:spore germination cell wall hydrolase CwlJ-like protein
MMMSMCDLVLCMSSDNRRRRRRRRAPKGGLPEEGSFIHWSPQGACLAMTEDKQHVCIN